MARGPYTADDARSVRAARSTCRSPTRPAAPSPAGRRGHAAAARLDLLPGQPGDGLAGDRARARQPRELRLRLGAELHRASSATTAATPTWARTSRPGATRSCRSTRTSSSTTRTARRAGMHQRRLHDRRGARRALRRQPGADCPDGDNTNIGGALVGKLDFSRIGLMGHSRGGDAVTSFIDYNRTRPAPGRKYNLRGVIALAPTDYERRAPYGVPYMTMFGYCEGDVTNLRARASSSAASTSCRATRSRASRSRCSARTTTGSTRSGSPTATTRPAPTPPAARSQPNNIRLSGGAYDRTRPAAPAIPR